MPLPQVVSAGFSRRLRFAMNGHDPRTGRQFIWHFFHARGGGGASQGCDGWSNVGEINVAGGIRSPSVELTEERFPFFIEHYEFRPDSGGDGTWRGGLGATFSMIYEGDQMALLNTAGDGVVNPPYGLCGGTAWPTAHLPPVLQWSGARVALEGSQCAGAAGRPHFLPLGWRWRFW